MDKKALYMGLAPTTLEIYREVRYDGGGFHIELTDLAVEDVSLIAQVYKSVKSIYNLWLYMAGEPNYDLLRDRLEKFAAPDFMSMVQQIGTATKDQGAMSTLMGNALHDLRGGALTSLTGYARLLPRLPNKEEYIRQAVYLARDQAKMMRNILPDLDRDVREADEGLKLHPIDDFVSKWDEFVFELPKKQVTVTAESEFDGYMTSRCLETSAVDRILYNYINNAARFAADSKVHFHVMPIGSGLTRWVVENKITDTQKKWLQTEVSKLSDLYTGGHTRGGNGIGLANCANFIAMSFGITPEEAVAQGYVGAKVYDNLYYGWFHWPIYKADGDEPVCDCGEDH